MSESVSFDRAAEFYDATRTTEPETLEAMLDVLEAELAPRGRALEIGVGTGIVALPLAQRGVDLVGVDISAAMMDKLVGKAGKSRRLDLVRADATCLPFGDATFGGAYVRWVLHLIPRWREAISELHRVVRPGGVIVVEPGGSMGPWHELLEVFRDEVGDAAAPVGLDIFRDPDALDPVFVELGSIRRELPRVAERYSGTLEEFFEATSGRKHSWTWRVPEDALHRAIRMVRAWAEERYGELTRTTEGSIPLTWRAYDIPE